MKSVRDLTIARLNERNRLWVGVAAAALLAGVGGLIIGRSTGDTAPAAAE